MNVENAYIFIQLIDRDINFKQTAHYVGHTILILQNTKTCVQHVWNGRA